MRPRVTTLGYVSAGIEYPYQSIPRGEITVVVVSDKDTSQNKIINTKT